MKSILELFAGPGAAIIFASLLTAWLLRSGRQPAQLEENGSVVRLQLGKAVRVLSWSGGVLFLLVDVFLIYIFVVTEDEIPLGYVILIPLVLTFMVAVLIVAPMGYTRLMDDGLQDYKVWRGQRWMAWQDIQRVHFSPVNKWVLVVDDNGQKFRLSIYLQGITTFFQWCDRKLDPSLYSKSMAREALARRKSAAES